MSLRFAIHSTITAALLTLSVCGHAIASQLYAVNFDGPANLYVINQTTGAISLVGASGVNDIGDLTSNAATGTIWGIQIQSTAASTLYNFNPSTGAAVNPITVHSVTGGGLSITSIAYDALSGTLYGNTTLSYSGVAHDQLYTINPTTGIATLVGTIGFDNVFALGFDTTGKLFGIAHAPSTLISINTITGTGTLIGNPPAGSYFDLAARPEDNVVFVTNTFAGTPSFSLLTINTGTGAVSDVGPFGAEINTVGLAFVGTAVPEPGTLVLLGLGLAGLAVQRRRK